jgi:predicted RNA-binding protein with PUA-like domain
MKKYWLMKSEPTEYSIDDLKNDGKTFWEGIRNYQARNFMMKDMKVGDEVLFYHSSCKIPAVVGIAKVCTLATPDPTCWSKRSKYYDEKSSKDNPRWFAVTVKFVKKFKHPVSLEMIKENKRLKNMLVIKKGMRLSIQPVEKNDFEEIKNM